MSNVVCFEYQVRSIPLRFIIYQPRCLSVPPPPSLAGRGICYRTTVTHWSVELLARGSFASRRRRFVTRMGCAGSKEPKAPELHSNSNSGISVDGISVAEKPGGGSLQRKKSTTVGARPLTPDAATHGATRASPRTPVAAARAARPSRALPAPSHHNGTIPQRWRVGRPGSGAWA